MEARGRKMCSQMKPSPLGELDGEYEGGFACSHRGREKLKSYGDKWVGCVRVMPLPTDHLYSRILQRILHNHSIQIWGIAPVFCASE